MGFHFEGRLELQNEEPHLNALFLVSWQEINGGLCFVDKASTLYYLLFCRLLEVKN